MQTNPAKNILQIFLPDLIKILGDDRNFGWTKVNSLVNDLVKKRTEIYGSGTIMVNATIFDVMVSAKNGTKQTLLQLDFFNRFFKDLNNLLNDDEKIMIRLTIENVLKSPDNNYMNFVGEIAALTNLMRTGLYRLEKVEYPIDNGKSIDFLLRNITTNERVLAEIVSIRLDESKVVNDKQEMEKFILNRVNQKLSSKGSQNINQKFFLVPIIWGPKNCLKIYSDFFKEYKIDIEYIIEPLAFLSFIDAQGKYLHRFSRISKLYDIDPKSLTKSGKNYIDGIKNKKPDA